MKDEERFSLKITSFKGPTAAEVYSFRIGHGDWGVLLLDEASGTVSINSSYGDWANSWTAAGRGAGVTLKEFFCSCGPDYLADKLDDSKDQFDQEATIRDMRRQIVEERRGRGVDKEDARKAWDGLDDMAIENYESADRFHDDLDRDVDEYFQGEAFHFLSYKKASEYLWLRYGVLPALLEELRKTLPAIAGPVA
jgi:hypothetical protein